MAESHEPKIEPFTSRTDSSIRPLHLIFGGWSLQQNIESCSLNSSSLFTRAWCGKSGQNKCLMATAAYFSPRRKTLSRQKRDATVLTFTAVTVEVKYDTEIATWVLTFPCTEAQHLFCQSTCFSLCINLSFLYILTKMTAELHFWFPSNDYSYITNVVFPNFISPANVTQMSFLFYQFYFTLFFSLWQEIIGSSMWIFSSVHV